MAIGDQARPRVFVYCEDPSHGGRTAVTAFCRSAETGDWEEWRAGPARSPGVAVADGAAQLTCRRCGARTAARIDTATLTAVLDVLESEGISHATLPALAAAAAHLTGAGT